MHEPAEHTNQQNIRSSPVLSAILVNSPANNADEVVDAGGGVILVEHAPSVQSQLHGGVDAAGNRAPLVDLGLHGLTARHTAML